MKLTWKNERRKVADLIPADYNPRALSDKARRDLESSIEEFNEVEPVVINTDNHLIGGHQRTTIYADLGIEEIDVRVPSRKLTLEEEMRLNIRLNKNTGAWDIDMLSSFDKNMLADVGFESLELDSIFRSKVEEDSEFDPELHHDSIIEPKAKLGQIYQLGDHTLMCGDATDAEHVRALVGGNAIEMVFTDPPYNVDYSGKTKEALKIDNDKMSTKAFGVFMDKALKNMLDHCPGVFYICMSSTELATLKDSFEKNGGHWQSFIIWVKNNFTLGRTDWQNQYEPILYGWNGAYTNHYFVGMRDQGNTWDDIDSLKPTFDGQETTLQLPGYILKLKGEVTGTIIRKREQTDIWREKKPTRSTEHPTMKPIKLMTKAIMASSHRGGGVLDTFGGSGSTLIACQETGRRCYMLELDPKYVDTIIARWESLTGDKAILL